MRVMAMGLVGIIFVGSDGKLDRFEQLLDVSILPVEGGEKAAA